MGTKEKDLSLEQRLEEVNRKLNHLTARFEKERQARAVSRRWWHDDAGRFEGDPVFAEIVRLGKAQRGSRSGRTVNKRARP